MKLSGGLSKLIMYCLLKDTAVLDVTRRVGISRAAKRRARVIIRELQSGERQEITRRVAIAKRPAADDHS